MREKLIELLDEATAKLKELCGGLNNHDGNDIRADHLIKNGVTLDNQVSSSTWISVSERLPTKEDANEDGCVLVCGHGGLIEGMDLDQVTIFKELIRCWMSLPKPPKEGE